MIRRRTGFTLLELLIVAALLPLVSFAIFANFSSGARLWEVLRTTAEEEDILIFYTKAQRDFSDIFHYGRIPIAGDAGRFTFATRIDAPPAMGGDRGIGSVSYYYDPKTQAIEKETRDLSRIFREKPGDIRTLLSGVTSCRFTYFSRDASTDTYGWLDAWVERPLELPRAVRIEFRRLSPNGNASDLVKTLYLPAGG